MVEEKIIEILAEYKGCPITEINIENSFEELGLDSLDTVEIVMSLEEAFNIELEITGELKTIKDVAAAITKLI
ncbi:MAG: phosphopantetheine-binding protein [Clostridia bacterium]